MSKSFFAVLVGVTLAAPAFGQALDTPATEEDRETLIIIGARVPAPADALAGSTTVLTEADITRTGAQFISEALERVPGVAIAPTGAFGGQTGVRLRGGDPAQTLVLIDGVEVNDPSAPDGAFDFATLDTAGVARIEVLRGPQSALWGANALGGVINIVSARPTDGVNTQAFLEAGSFSTVRAGARTGFGAPGRYAQVGVSTTRTRGISKADENAGATEDDSYEATTLTARAGGVVGRAEVDASVRYTTSETELDGFDFGLGRVADNGDENAADEISGAVTVALPTAGGLRHEVQAAASRIERDFFLASFATTFPFQGDRANLRYTATYGGERTRLAGGLEVERETAISDSPFGGYDVDVDTVSAFAAGQRDVGARWGVSGGVRVDDADTYDAEVTGQLGATYDATPGLTLRANVGTGFRAPTVSEELDPQFGSLVNGIDLDPERSVTAEIGARFARADHPVTADATVFVTETDNLIALNASFIPVNIEEARVIGAEAALGLALTDTVTVDASLTLLDAENETTGARLLRTPETVAAVSATWTPRAGAALTVSAIHNGDEDDTGGVIDSWTRFDIGGALALSGAVEVYARVENLTDEAYQQVLGYGAPGRSARIGARARF